MQEILLKARYFERGLSKCLKKVTFFVNSSPVPFSKQNNQKRGLELVTSGYSGYETSSEKFLYELCII